MRLVTSISSAIFAIGLVTGTLLACSSDDAATPAATPNPDGGVTTKPDGGGVSAASAQPVVDNYVKNVYQSYSDALAGAKALQVAIDAFIAAPSAELQDAAKTAYKAARVPYMQTEGYRFYQGPIDNNDDGPEGDINSWPLDENFIDYTRDDANAGIINDPSITIDKTTLKAQNTLGGEKNVSIGYHAIEFLLWGQDDIDVMLRTQGHRDFTDYTTKANADRRKQYLQVTTQLLVDDLQTVTDQWAPGAENYAKTFAADPNGAIAKLLTGIGSLANAELSGERMIVAYKDKDQEDEHSCFSDLTNVDLQGNFHSIKNVYMGTYGSNTTGASVSSLVAAVNPTLDTQVKADLATTEQAFTDMQAELFDVAIALDGTTPANLAVLHAIQGVQKLADDITQVGDALGVQFDLDKSDAQL